VAVLSGSPEIRFAFIIASNKITLVPPSFVCVVIVSSPFDPQIGLVILPMGDSMKQASDLQFRICLEITHTVEIGMGARCLGRHPNRS
jgi:hypothetical protein